MKFKVGDKVKLKSYEDNIIYKIVNIEVDAFDDEYVSFMVNVNDKNDYSGASWYEDELTFVGRDQKEESSSDINSDKITLDDIKVFADWQTNLQYCFGISIVSMNFYGTSITNPWLDETGRFELDNKHAIIEYGVKRYTKFIKEAIEALRTMKEYNII